MLSKSILSLLNTSTDDDWLHQIDAVFPEELFRNSYLHITLDAGKYTNGGTNSPTRKNARSTSFYSVIGRNALEQ